MCNDRFLKACFETCLLTMYRLCWINFSFIKKTFINVPIVGGHVDIETAPESSRSLYEFLSFVVDLELGLKLFSLNHNL